MEEEFDKGLYTDQGVLFFHFLIKKHQWSSITKEDYMRWSNNFSQIPDGQYIQARILNSLIYYSEDDMIRLLKDAIASIFENDIVLPYLLEKSFSCLSSELDYQVSAATKKTIIIPSIEDLHDPGSSGPEIIRDLRNHLMPQFDSAFSYNISPNMEYESIIIVDDCIGSGDQCKAFWEEATIKGGTLLREWCKSKGIKAYYLTLIGYKEAVVDLRKLYPDLTIICAEFIDNRHQLFSDQSRCWKDSVEQSEISNRLQTVLSEYGLSLRGYNNLSFAVALHKTIPDWSIPALYKNKNGWQHLLERKNTYG